MLALGVGLAIARAIYLTSVPASALPADAAAAGQRFGSAFLAGAAAPDPGSR